LGVSLSAADKLYVVRDLMRKEVWDREVVMRRDMEEMLSEVKNAREIWLYYQGEEIKIRREREELKKRLKAVNAYHKSLMNNRRDEIEGLKKEIDELKEKWRKDVDRLKEYSEKETKVREKIEEQLRKKIEKLNQELGFVKTILKFPKLYFNYQNKKFEEIREGLLNKDKKWYKKATNGHKTLYHNPKRRIQSPNPTTNPTSKSPWSLISPKSTPCLYAPCKKSLRISSPPPFHSRIFQMSPLRMRTSPSQHL
jgi:hypothetical protein